MKILFNFLLNKPSKRKRTMGIPADELKLYGSKEAAIAANSTSAIESLADERDESVSIEIKDETMDEIDD